ncbi:flagellar biosynthetic protein FliR [uncultured Gemmobacter sp.]|uniref:flagellar biosynthetic protein FliR n=1 Tax=uncultured Gemmobacter sp. TaxID=1095917 RepID=UPI000A96E0ED|nr:flagellar biosynthetic protein FliR [uncultured Gemmobacter sp.]
MTDLFALLSQLGAFTAPLFAAAFVVLLRVSGTVALMPGFGETLLPVRIKLVAALAFTLVVAPVVMPQGMPPDTIGFSLFLSEPAIGLMFGIGLRLFIFALQTAGAIIAQATSLSQFFGGMGESQPAMGHALSLAGITLFMVMDLHVRAAQYLVESYATFPLGTILPSGDLLEWGLWQVGRSFRLGLGFATPFVIGSLIYNIAIGVVNKAMPQLMVAFIGAPALTLGGLALFALTAPLFLPVWGAAIEAYFLDPLAAP